MPRKYKRKPGVAPRNIAWSEESLQAAFEDIKKGEKGINEISRTYGNTPNLQNNLRNIRKVEDDLCSRSNLPTILTNYR